MIRIAITAEAFEAVCGTFAILKQGDHMGDDSLIPMSDEQAKLGRELIKAVRDTAGYFTDMFGDIPKDLLGYLIGDRVKAKRVEQWEMLWQRTRERQEHRGTDPEPPSLKYAIPILEAAADEENEALQDLWSRLLAAAMDPGRRDAMRQSFIQTVKQMDPMDALVLKAIRDNDSERWDPNGLYAIAGKLNCSHDEVRVSFEHLFDLDCINFRDNGGPRLTPYLNPFGTLLMNVVSD